VKRQINKPILLANLYFWNLPSLPCLIQAKKNP